jgi:hypothetical protein
MKFTIPGTHGKNRKSLSLSRLTLYLTTLFFLKLALWLRQQTVEAEQIPTVIKTNETFLMRGKEPAKVKAKISLYKSLFIPQHQGVNPTKLFSS